MKIKKLLSFPPGLTLLLVIAFLLAACSDAPGVTPVPVEAATQTVDVSPSPTSFVPPSPDSPDAPTATPVPLALIVNGETITLEEYQASLERFRAAVPEASHEETSARVLDDFVSSILLAQGAAEQGFVVSDELLAERLQALANELGGEAALQAWQQNYGYTAESFEAELRRAIAAAWMRDQIAASVPDSLVQVRARHILVSTREEAQSILDQVASGTSFDIMLVIYEPQGLGELGWFPRGYLFHPEIEEAAFNLEEGELSGIVETELGFHILQVTDRAEDRPLDPEVRRVLQARALDAWLEAYEAESEIEFFVP